MKRERKHYRTVTQLLEVVPELQRIIGLKYLPHYTTIQKFFRRFSTVLFERILGQTTRLFELSGLIAIDSSGFSSNCASRYFMMIKYRMKKGVWKDSYMKNSLTVDVDKQVVITNKSRKDKGHDNLDFIPLIGKTSKVMKIRTVIADKGYDSEANHKFVRKVLKAGTVIPVRERPGRVNGRFRKEMARGFDAETYKKRQVIETVFFVMKRMFGDTVYSRTLRQQKKELKIVCITYNLYRYAKSCCCLITQEGFLHPCLNGYSRTLSPVYDSVTFFALFAFVL